MLVGVINRQRDLIYARDEGWYRIPQARMPRGVQADYLAFFLSGRTFKERSGGIHFFARTVGLELAYRHELLPRERAHPRADHVYYRIALADWQVKEPPVRNPTRRPISFIYTTWDRFSSAETIADLYSTADYYVDRVYHALRDRGIEPDRYWEAERETTGIAPGVRILCEDGSVFEASTEPGSDFLLDGAQSEDAILRQILEQIAKRGGPVMLSVPHPK